MATRVPSMELTEMPSRKPTVMPSPALSTPLPTLAPSPALSTPLPTLAPSPALSTPLPTVKPTMDPTASPSTEVPSYNPTVMPSLSTPLPTVKPTMDPTASPSTEVPSYNPTRAPSMALPTFIPTYFPTRVPTFIPSYFSTITTVNANVQHRVENAFRGHSVFLQNNVEVNDIMQSMLVISNATRDEIDTLRASLNSYKYGLGANKLWLFIAIDHVIQVLENESKLQHIGLTELAENFHTECILGGENHVVTLTSALGSGNVSNVIRDGSKDISGVIGNNTLSAITLVNVTSNAAGTISAMFTSLSVAFANAIGANELLLDRSTIISGCNSSNYTYPIYEISSNPSIMDHINGFVACSNWVANANDYYITKDTSRGCVHVPNNLALSTCQQYLGLYHDEL